MTHYSAKHIARTAAGIIAALCMTSAFAHPGDHHVTASLAAGFSHPFSGLDHLLAFGAIGLWAAQLRGAAAWRLPLIFLTVMALGAATGVAGIMLPGAEAGIAASVVVLGLLVAFAFRMPGSASMALVSVFALLHGYAHGVELPVQASAGVYGLGFIAATALLHLAGFAAGISASNGFAGKAIRILGAGIAATGVYLLAAVA